MSSAGQSVDNPAVDEVAVAEELEEREEGEEVAEAKESKVTTTTIHSSITPTSTTNDPSSVSGTVSAPHQLKCSVTLDKLPKRVRLALTKNKRSSVGQLTNGLSSEHADSAQILCLFCDRFWPDRHQNQLHQDQEHLTASLGRRASGRASAINSFPGCSLCNVAENKLFTSHSNDLEALFAHLTEKHADRYFACRPCNERFQDAEALAAHRVKVHGVRRDRRKSMSLGELNRVSTLVDPTEGDRVERKVTRQSNGSSVQQSVGMLDEPTSSSLSRLAQAQNRFPLRGPARAIKGRLAANSQKANETRNGRGSKLSRSTSVSSTGSSTNQTTSTGTPPPSGTVSGSVSGGFSKSTSNLPSGNVFDENFYETITVTVRRNLSKWVDGKIEDKSAAGNTDKSAEETTDCTSSELLLDHAPPAVRSSLFRTPPVVCGAESEIHEATALSAVTAFPTLLTAEQYGLEGQAGGKIKRMFTKNSWKWKFDFVKKYKYVNEGGKIVKKAKEQNLGQRDLSKLDMWTQLTMRKKHEETKRPVSEESSLDTSSGSTASAVGESVRAEKRRQVSQLDTILDSRLLPQIGTEQNEQRLIKLEAAAAAEEEREEITMNFNEANQLPKNEPKLCETDDFPLGLQLRRTPNPKPPKTCLTLSGEWARPRCYVCFGCGAKFETIKLLQDHKLIEHPNTQTTHYEMVGRELIEGDLHQHLYIPKHAISTGNEHAATTSEERAEKPQRGRRANPVIAKIADDATVPCSKCKKDCAGRFELYRHMLDCVGDYAWLMAKKRFKYRYYGNRSRRRKSNARSIFGCVRPPKKAVKKERLDRIKRRKMRSRRKPQKPSDAETIERMLANLPEKRVSRTVTTTPSKAASGAGTTPTAVTPAKANSQSGSSTLSSTSKKLPSVTKTTNTPTSNPSAVGATKRNLRSKLEGEAKAVASATGAVKAGNSKKGKVDKVEVKVSDKSETKSNILDKEDKEEVVLEPEREVRKRTNGKVEQQQDEAVDAEEPSELVAPVGKRKTLLNRLASNTKGIIKKIGRKMKGKKVKGKQNPGLEDSKMAVPFLDEPAQGPLAVPVVPPEEAETVRKLEAAPVELVNKEKEEKPVLVKSASVAVEDVTKPEGQNSIPVVERELQNITEKVTGPEAIPSVTGADNNDREMKELPNKTTKSELPLPDLGSPQISPSLSVPSNLSSPMTSPTMPKRRVRKLNDCIARLTDKLQEKMGKPFSKAPSVEQVSPTLQPVIVNPVAVIRVPELPLRQSLSPIASPPKQTVQYNETPVPLDVPLNLSLKRDSSKSANASNLLLATAVPKISEPGFAEECGVVDLSVKDKPKRPELLFNKSTKPLAVEIPRVPIVTSIIPEVVKSPMEPVQNLKRLPEELIVPQAPKMGSYEVIKIPTYLPQKPLKGSRRSNKGKEAGNSSAATAAAAKTKSSTTSAIEKITELVADIVRNKKREAALKELAGSTAIPQPLFNIGGGIFPTPVANVEVSRVEEVIVPTLVQLPLIPPPVLEVKKPTGRKRVGKTKVGLEKTAPIVVGPVIEAGPPAETLVGETVKTTLNCLKEDSQKEIPIVIPEASKGSDIVPEIIQTPIETTVEGHKEAVVEPVITTEEVDIQTAEVNPGLVVPQEIKNVVKKPTKSKAAPKSKKGEVIVEPPESIIIPVEIVPTTPSRSRRTNAATVEKKKKTVRFETMDEEESSKAAQEPSKEVVQRPAKVVNGMVLKNVADITEKEDIKVTLTGAEIQTNIISESVAVVQPTEKATADTNTADPKRPSEEEAPKTAAPTKVRKKRQSELAQILATQPVINNTERDISLTRRKSICNPETLKRIDSPKLKPSPPKKKKENVELVSPVIENLFKDADAQEIAKPIEKEVNLAEIDVEEEITANIVEATIEKKEEKPLQKGKQPRVTKTKKHKQEIIEDQKTTETQITSVEAETLVEALTENLAKNHTPKPKKKRRSELTQIIADQLLESFKEVDESEKDNLKILHDLSWADETMEIASRLKQSPIPRRQVTKKKSHLVENPSRKSPLVGSTKQAQPQIVHKKIVIAREGDRNEEVQPTTTTLENEAEEKKKTETKVPSMEAAKIESLPQTTTEKEELISPRSTTSRFNTPAPATTNTDLASTPKPIVTKQQPQTASEEMSLFWKQNVEKETGTERRVDWVAKTAAPKSSSDLSDEGSTNKQTKPTSSASSSCTTTTFVLKPSRLQAIASPPLIDSFDLLRNCDRSSTSSSFCSPVVSPIGEPKKSLLNVNLSAFPGPPRATVTLPANGAVVAPVNLLQFRDGPREVDESDGDLEDNVSVHSSDSMESSMTSMTKSKAPRKRRKRSLLTKKKMRGHAGVKANKENGLAVVEKFHCDICNKTFEKADRLAKHKITLTHISRLSEIEFLNSQTAKVEESSAAQPSEVKASLPEPIPVLPPRSPEPPIVAVGTGAAITPTPVQVPNHHRSPLTLGSQHNIHHHQSTLHNVQLEPISSPEQPQQSYLMSGLPSIAGGARTESAFGAAMANIPKRPTINVAGLSQEEKLFYECCNMLKGSDRVGTQSENNSLTPRSNEAVSTWYSKTSTAFAIRSPTSSNYHRQKSPKYAFSKLDLNQFSDISSDSDNTYPSRGRPLVNSGALMPPSFHNVIASSRDPDAALGRQQLAVVTGSNCNVGGNLSTSAGVVSPLRRENAAAIYSDSDMGDSFPSAPGASDNESYVRTILDRSNNNNGHAGYSGRAEGYKGPVHEGAVFRRDEHSLSNDQSAAGKVKTKAAMKGFDNFRVSIPTDGLDMDQALNGGSSGGGGLIMHQNPHLDSKLASLADIALRSSTLPLIETAISGLAEEQTAAEEPVEWESTTEEALRTQSNDHLDDTAPQTTPSEVAKPPAKRQAKGGRKAQQTRTDKNSVGNRLGFKAKKRKGSEAAASPVVTTPVAQRRLRNVSAAEVASKNGLDVYDFDDSQGSTEAPILPMKKSGKGTSEATSSKDKALAGSVVPDAAPVVVKPKGKNRLANKKGKSTAAHLEDELNVSPVQAEVLEQSSQLSSDSFSDRDDFNYNSPAIEESDMSSHGTPVKVPPTPPLKPLPMTKKAPKKPLDNVQKKSLIMGRIFKNNAQKHHKPDADKVTPVSSPTNVEETTKKVPPKVELDKLFDSLKEEEPKPIKRSYETAEKKVLSIKADSPVVKSSSPVESANGPKKVEVQKSILKKKAKVSVGDDADKETKKLIEELMNDDLGVGQRKSKRKCIQQVNFVETWSSDEYEEFHSTKDIIAMIEANEKKTGASTRKKKLPSATVEEPIKLSEKKPVAGKIQNRRKTIGFKETTDDDFGRSNRKEVSVRFSPIRDFVPQKLPQDSTRKKEGALKHTSGEKEWAGVGGDGAKQVGRQKRVSSERLYYWSSSSSADEDESGGVGPKAGKGVNGRVKVAGDDTGMNDDEEDNDSAMEQHGWIVGGSHKKLVTMLAHAKGKKSDVALKK